MIIIMKHGATREHVEELSRHIERWGVKANPIYGEGTIVIGLASVIIGEVLFGTRSFKNCLISVILGSIVYRLVIAVVLQLGMPPNDLKLFTAILVAAALSMPLIREKIRSRKARS